jgi:polyisoprenoid-binding protein YceI
MTALLLCLSLLAPAAVAQDPTTPAATVAAAPAPAVNYTVDPAKGLVYVLVLKDETTVLSSASHNHAIRAQGHSGQVTWSPDDPSQCKVSITVPVNSLDVDPQWLRDRVGYTQKLKDGDRETVKKNMLAKDQLDGATHPNITFQSTRCTGSQGSYKVYGNLTIKGKTAPVTSLMRIEVEGAELTATGRFKTTHTAFGMEPFSALMGALKNRDELEFVLDVRANAG